MSRVATIAVFALALTLAVSTSLAQSKSASSSSLGVDIVRLKSGRTVRGAVWQRKKDGSLLFVVRRDWLHGAYPEWSDEIAKANQTSQETAWKNVCERLDMLLADPPDAPRYTFYLRQELERLKKNQDLPAEDSEFVWLDVDAKQIAQLTPATSSRQRVAIWGWSEHLIDVETRDTASITKDLQKAGIKLDASPPDLSGLLPARPQNDREWTARLAIVEYTLRKSLDLQGTGDIVIPTSPGKPVDFAPAMHTLMQKQLQSALSELTGSPPPGLGSKSADRNWLPSAIRAAEQADVRGFRVTRVEVGVEAMQASVVSEFVARVSEDKWVTVWQTSEVADGNQARPEQEARITQDPQVKAATDAVKAFGLGGDQSLTQAIRVGAATMSAQQAVDRRFFEFREHYVKRLDGPPLSVVGP